MYIHTFLVVSLAVSQAFAETSPKVKDIEDELDINKINKDLDLREGDIMENFQRNGILGEDKRWPSPVPYVLDSSLDMNAKGIILRAFDQFRLKTCMDFKPRDSEMYYLTIEKLTGCYSYVGRTLANGQVVSIGQNCDIIAIVEHELLHALGFYHEQSRYDRDDYVTIVYENIQEGYQHNFIKYSENNITTLGTPYDFYSVMHYGKDDFTNGNGSTIITKKLEFQDVIGQRLEMSSNDVLKLNRMYSCNASVAFKESCSFSDSGVCGMSRCSRSVKGSENVWERVTQAVGGPYTDHSNLDTNGTGFFMHASTASGQEGDKAWLDSREMTPSRKCSVQCLQFYYYHNGNKTDQLNIWIREYRDERDPNGTLRLMGQITGSPASYWQLHHVSLNATKTFQVEFEVRKGAGQSTGGFSIDDINLSETECPHHTWQIRDFVNVAKNTDTWLLSPRHYSRDGYAYQLMVVLRSSYIGVYPRLLSGKYDDQLQWPCPWRQITFLLMDQNPNIQLRMSKQNSISTDPEQIDYKNGQKYLFWDNPRKNGTFYKQEGNESIYATNGWGYGYFMSFKDIKDKGFLKGGDIFFLTSMQDISSLQYAGNNSLPCPTPPPQDFTLLPSKRVEGPCSARVFPTTTTTTTTKTTTTTTTTTTVPPTTDKEHGIFDFSSGLVSSPAIIVMALMLWLIH